MAKTWKITATYGAGKHSRPEVYYVTADTLYDAFHGYYKTYGMKCLTEIQITEVKHNERSEGIPGADQVV